LTPIDLEIDCSDADEIVNSIKNFAPSFGGINLEDIAAPDCFIIEQKLKEILDIPVFHDDQHGTGYYYNCSINKRIGHKW
jgi:malate dehydrogenase (oxaloacetate-decarboxylating)(NADP+)